MKKSKSKPLIEMTRTELRDTFDDIGADIDASLLNDARSGKTDQVIIAAAVLILPDGREVLCYHTEEYGDGEGVRMIEDFLGTIHRKALLNPGESIRLARYRVLTREELSAT